jgi:hypothetical protein
MKGDFASLVGGLGSGLKRYSTLETPYPSRPDAARFESIDNTAALGIWPAVNRPFT